MTNYQSICNGRANVQSRDNADVTIAQYLRKKMAAVLEIPKVQGTRVHMDDVTIAQ